MRKWSEKEVEVLRDLYMRGVPMDLICQVLNRTTASVEFKITHLHLKRPFNEQINYQLLTKIKRMFPTGETKNESENRRLNQNQH
ncbi:MAG: hypothetical protein QXK47_02415 [Candidatus Bathyarchaeia archaeon]